MRIVRNFCSARPTARAMSISLPDFRQIDIEATPKALRAIFWMHSMEVVTGHQLAHCLSFYAVAAVMVAMHADTLQVQA
jgi:hypothetical protein